MFFVKSKRWPLFLLRLISKHGWTKQANRWWFIALYRFVWPLWSRLSFCTLQTKPETNESNKFYSLLLIRRTWLKSSERLNHVTDNIFSWWWWWWWYEEEIRENIIRKVYQIFFLLFLCEYKPMQGNFSTWIKFSIVIWPFFIFVFIIMNGISLLFSVSKTKPFRILNDDRGCLKGIE